jgi:hypothetical protein
VKVAWYRGQWIPIKEILEEATTWGKQNRTEEATGGGGAKERKVLYSHPDPKRHVFLFVSDTVDFSYGNTSKFNLVQKETCACGGTQHLI